MRTLHLFWGHLRKFTFCFFKSLTDPEIHKISDSLNGKIMFYVFDDRLGLNNSAEKKEIGWKLSWYGILAGIRDPWFRPWLLGPNVHGMIFFIRPRWYGVNDMAPLVCYIWYGHISYRLHIRSISYGAYVAGSTNPFAEMLSAVWWSADWLHSKLWIQWRRNTVHQSM